MYPPNEDYQVVMHLNRWDRTKLALSIKERLTALIKGQLDLTDIIGYSSVGFVPVFEKRIDADAYNREIAGGTAPISSVRRRIEE